MHLDLRHLRLVDAIHRFGGLGRAAEALHLTQSALSHQLKALEEQAGAEMVVRRARPLRLTAAGLRLLRTADLVLPALARAQAEFRDVEAGRAGRLHVGMECASCLDWLLPVLDRFRRAWPEVDLDLRSEAEAAGVAALLREVVDVVVTTDPEPVDGVAWQALFDYAPVLVVAAGHPLAAREFAEAEDLAGEVLLTSALPRARLDAFAAFLDPAGVSPAAHRTVGHPELMLMQVAGGRGVAVLPDWVARRRAGPEHAVLRLGHAGVLRRLHAGLRADDLARPYLGHWLRLARTEPLRVIGARIDARGAGD